MYTFYLRIFKMSYYQTKQDRRQKKQRTRCQSISILSSLWLFRSFYLFYSKFILCRLAGFAVFSLSPESLVLQKTYRCVSSIARQKTTIVSCQRQQNKRMKTIRNLNASCYIKILVTKRLKLNLSTEKKHFQWNSRRHGSHNRTSITMYLKYCFSHRTSFDTFLMDAFR